MSQKRLSMRRIRELLRLKHEFGRSHREIAGALGIANSMVSDFARRAAAAGFTWPLEEGLSVVPSPDSRCTSRRCPYLATPFDSPPAGRARSPTMRSSASQILTTARAS